MIITGVTSLVSMRYNGKCSWGKQAFFLIHFPLRTRLLELKKKVRICSLYTRWSKQQLSIQLLEWSSVNFSNKCSFVTGEFEISHLLYWKDWTVIIFLNETVNYRYTKQHQSYDELFSETISTLFYGVGNLKDSTRHFIAIMVSYFLFPYFCCILIL